MLPVWAEQNIKNTQKIRQSKAVDLKYFPCSKGLCIKMVWHKNISKTMDAQR